MKEKIGVYICHCGGNISDYVDVDKVREAVENDNGILLSKTTVFACADANQKDMENDIKEHGLDGVVVASCSPTLHQITFRSVAERAGLNKYNYVHANIREQGSWAHSDDKAGATENAIRNVKAAIARVRNSMALDPIKISSKKAVAVIGAGVAGIKSAIELARTGSQVYLIERRHYVGGRTPQWEELFSSNEKGKDLIAKLYKTLQQYDNLKIFTGAEVVSQSGNIGNFTLNIKLTPTYIKDSLETSELKKAVEVCPISVPEDFNFNLSQRKAIYQNFPGQFPERPAIDIENCTSCGECEKVCNAIDFSQKEENVSVNVGSIVFATGFDPYTPQENEYGYGSIDNVVTLPEFKRMIANSNGKLVHKGKEIQNIAYIYCVGSRQPEGENKYCSRFCCTANIHTALDVKKKFKNIQNYHFTRGVRTYGKQEAYYKEALQMGDVFLQSEDNELPTVTSNGSKAIIKVKDILTEQKELELHADLVVLSTSMVPRKDNSTADLFKIPKGRDKFLKEIHLKLRPVETVIDGITIAGTCQGPMNIMESVNSSLSASTKSYSYISKGELELEPIIAEVSKDDCSWCDACSNACPFDAISKSDEGDFATINNSVCKGCGMCLPVCPKDAIELSAYSNKEIEEMIDMLALD